MKIYPHHGILPFVGQQKEVINSKKRVIRLKKINTKVTKALVLFALCISFFAFAEENKAANVEEVLISYKNKEKPFVINQDYDHTYMMLNYINGYNVTKSYEDISTLSDMLTGYIRSQYYLTYSKY